MPYPVFLFSEIEDLDHHRFPPAAVSYPKAGAPKIYHFLQQDVTVHEILCDYPALEQGGLHQSRDTFCA
jgi:hypothetical protein